MVHMVFTQKKRKEEFQHTNATLSDITVLELCQRYSKLHAIYSQINDVMWRL